MALFLPGVPFTGGLITYGHNSRLVASHGARNDILSVYNYSVLTASLRESLLSSKEDEPVRKLDSQSP